jgi:hypothetical protein
VLAQWRLYRRELRSSARERGRSSCFPPSYGRPWSQIALRSSEASKETIGLVNLQGNGGAWLVDGDEGGSKNASHLRSSGIPEGRVIVVGGAGSGLAVEDLVDPELYMAAVNKELRRSGVDDAIVLRAEDLGAVGRALAVDKWCYERGVDAPSKDAVAHRIAGWRFERHLVDSDGLVFYANFMRHLLTAGASQGQAVRMS